MNGSTTLSAAAVAAAASKALPPLAKSLAPAWAASGWAAVTRPWSDVRVGRLPCMVVPRVVLAGGKDGRVGDDCLQGCRGDAAELGKIWPRPAQRSEEHTSELQSL